MRISITRTINVPDASRLELYRRIPELGPKILFFSGGTALKAVSAELIYYTHNSIHLMTPVDSGGSSAVLREAFGMPAIGDIRNRLMALADRGLTGNPEIFRLFTYRFPKDASLKKLQDLLDDMVDGRHMLIMNIPDPMRKIIRQYLYDFRKQMPEGFDLRGASMGNLVLASGYLTNRRHLDPVIYIFSKLVNVRGIVRPVTNKDLHLVTDLEDGQTLLGQHLLTGKEVPPIRSRVRRIYLSADQGTIQPVEAVLKEKMCRLIAGADLICYPMGSFYSSLICNLLPRGVGAAVSRNPCPKVFIPNTVSDPEQYGMTLEDQVTTLLDYLRRDDPGGIENQDVVNYILMDTNNGRYAGIPDEKRLAALGMKSINCRLVSMRSAPWIDEKLLVPTLLSLT